MVVVVVMVVVMVMLHITLSKRSLSRDGTMVVSKENCRVFPMLY